MFKQKVVIFNLFHIPQSNNVRIGSFEKGIRARSFVFSYVNQTFLFGIVRHEN